MEGKYLNYKCAYPKMIKLIYAFTSYNIQLIYYWYKNSQTTEKVSRNEDSGGAKPKIREKDSLSTNESSSSSKKEDDNRVGGAAASNSENKTDATEDSNANAAFECNICLDVAREAVISMCGHLFCWPCLHTWLETRPNRQICPVCKAGIGKDKVVPLYGRGKLSELVLIHFASIEFHLQV